jgi:hypothetical protein
MLDLPGQWQFYISLLEDATASIFVKLDVGEPIPDPARPYLLISRIWLEDPDENGMADPQEMEWIVENGLFQPAKVTQFLHARFVGYLISQGFVDSFYYISEFETGKVAEVLASLWPNVTHQHRHEVVLDEDWSQYRDVLYPSPLDFRVAQNREKYQQYLEGRLAQEGLLPGEQERRSNLIAEEFGMDLDQVRALNKITAGQAEHLLIHYQREWIVHSLYFPTKQVRSSFIKTLNGEGFSVIDEMPPEPTMAPTPYGLLIEREESMTPLEIDNTVLSLWSRAEDCRGRYIDWEVADDLDDDEDE